MPSSRVFILSSHGLFARGVQSLLSKEAEVEVVGVEKDERQALERIEILQPDVILMDSGASRDDSKPSIAEIFEKAPEARVINLSLQESGVDIYDRHRIVACGPAELVQAIRGKGEV